ncbi:MAG: hypothetical protein RMH75_06525 [Archaeoglobaceae archaeon]|nr:hypothetical protein [Archaeoglobaceae archaeon]MDW7990297.1 hypothetical protein [Archaeoglobaceae archaeon]
MRVEENLPIEIDWNDFATPQGNGYFSNGIFAFRRVDKIWLLILDNEIARITNTAIKKFTLGRPITFDELTASCSSETPIKAAYALGILGKRNFPMEKEEKIYKITANWLENVRFFNVYYKGLSLLENYMNRTICSIPTFWWNKRVSLGEKTKIENESIFLGDHVVEDKLVRDLVGHFMDKKILEIIPNAGIEEYRILSLCIGAGLLRLSE